MKTWLKTDEELIKNWWRTDEELVWSAKDYHRLQLTDWFCSIEHSKLSPGLDGWIHLSLTPPASGANKVTPLFCFVLFTTTGYDPKTLIKWHHYMIEGISATLTWWWAFPSTREDDVWNTCKVGGSVRQVCLRQNTSWNSLTEIWTRLLNHSVLWSSDHKLNQLLHQLMLISWGGILPVPLKYKLAQF